MNAFVERFIGTLRREALDHFLLISEKQVMNITKKFIHYYHKQRPHQGIGEIPDDPKFEKTGIIKKEAVLSGLHHSYFRSSA